MIDQQEKEEAVKDAFWRLLGNRASLQGKGLISRLAKSTGFDDLTIQGTLAGLAQSKWFSGVYANGIPTGNVLPLTERPVAPDPPSLGLWTAALERSGLDENDCASLIPLHNAVSDFSDDDRYDLIKGLIKLRNDQLSLQGQPAFIVSAEYLLGSSKLLDSLTSKTLQAFGIQTNFFTGAPPVVLIAGPSNPINVVLVENPHAFWKAISTSAIEKTAFVVTFGYGLSRHGDEFGNQLASILESGSQVTGAVCAGAPPCVSKLLQHHNVSFWGDLDLEGLRIYLRLKKILPELTLSALYEPMLSAVQIPSKSHPYAKATAKHSQSSREIPSQECALSKLAAACVARAVDQELVTVESIVEVSERSFQISTI